MDPVVEGAIPSVNFNGGGQAVINNREFVLRRLVACLKRMEARK